MFPTGAFEYMRLLILGSWITYRLTCPTSPTFSDPQSSAIQSWLGVKEKARMFRQANLRVWPRLS